MRGFRTVRKDHMIPYTVGGRTFMVNERPEVKQVVQPRDLDAVVARMLFLMTSIVVLGAITWSTVAIGTLLSAMAPAWVSYLVAVVFDMTWVVCMGAEWLMRYDRPRARIPQAAGWAAMLVSVLTIAAEGVMVTGRPMIGAAGGIISVLAKGLWMVTMAISARRLSPLDQQWYEKAESAANAELAQVTMERKLAKVRARADQERAALAVLSGRDMVGRDTTAEIVSAPDTAGRDTTAEIMSAPDTAGRDTTAEPVPSDGRDTVVRLSSRPGITAHVRDMLDADPDLSDETIKDSVRTEFGPETKDDTIRKSIKRVRTA